MRMFVFLLVFVSLYGSLHFYAFIRANAAFGFGKDIGIPLAVLMVLMVFCPLFVRMLERQGMETLSRLLAHVGYTWMGFLFLLFCASLLMDTYRFLWGFGRVLFHYNTLWGGLSSKGAFLLALGVSALITLYAHFEAADIRTERVTIHTSRIPEELGRLRIVQVSDIHLGLIVREKRLERILGKVREADPDLLVSTGDLLDGQINDISRMIERFRDIHTRYGKFAIMGNHEYYAGRDRSLDFMKRSGFRVLRGERVSIPGIAHIVGVDDPAGERFGLREGIPEEALLSGFSPHRFVLLLKHRPLLNPKSIGLFDLQLSGHAHKGQIFPFTLLIKMIYPIDAGLLPLPKGGFLYVSRGSGTWGPRMRFLAPPEVTVIELLYQKEGS